MTEKNWDGTERRAGPDPVTLQAELKAVRHDLGRVAVAVSTLGSDEQMQKVMSVVLEEEKRHRQRILTKVIVGLIVVAMIGVAQITLTGQVKDAAEDAAKVSSFVDHCLVHPSEATPGECGNTQATGAQSAGLLAIFCYLRIPPEARSDRNAADCFRAGTEEARAAAAATTTTTGR